MNRFSGDEDRDENIGELVLETLLNSNINSIIDLNLGDNSSWFKHPDTEEERSSNVDLLAELISKQAGLQRISLYENSFSSNATQTIVTRIADDMSTSTNLKTLYLYEANFEANETVEKLADILQSARYLKECNIRY